jgi:hypothetical protein
VCVPEADRYQVPVLAWCSVRLPRIWPCETRRQLRTGKGNEYLTGLGFHVRSGLVEPEPEPSSQLVTLSETHVSARLTRHHARRRCRYRGTTATATDSDRQRASHCMRSREFRKRDPISRVSSWHARIRYPGGKLHRFNWMHPRNVSSTRCPVARPDREAARNRYERYQMTKSPHLTRHTVRHGLTIDSKFTHRRGHSRRAARCCATAVGLVRYGCAVAVAVAVAVVPPT